MRRYPFKKIDAFTGPGSSGNPAACIYPDAEMQDAEMLQIARELKGFVSEVVYCRPLPESAPPAFALRYFSSECEVEFCGHGTIACMYDLIGGSPTLADRGAIAIHTRKGALAVHANRDATGAVFIEAPTAEHLRAAVRPSAVAERLGIPVGAMDAGYPIAFINAGLNTLIVPIASLQDTIGMRPAMEPLRLLCEAHGIDIVTVFTRETADRGTILRTRVFAPRFGYLEDPATGSGNSAVGAYMLRHDLWQGGPVVIEQGPSEQAPNLVRLDTITDARGSRRVLFGGKATVRIAGEYLLADG
jgi:PhzF family phenazine biosynthesis protein